MTARADIKAMEPASVGRLAQLSSAPFILSKVSRVNGNRNALVLAVPCRNDNYFKCGKRFARLQRDISSRCMRERERETSVEERKKSK